MTAWQGLRGPYGTIVADPPWQYRKSAQPEVVSHQRMTAEDNYSTMTMREIAALPVESLAADNAHLYLWVTNPRMFGDRNDPSHFGPVHIIEAWGFRYVTMLTWHKGGAPGMGSYFRGDTEHLLFGVRGKAPIPADRRESNIFEAARAGHSVKPGCLLDMVERVSPGPYVELFARQPRLGWDSWGHGYEQAVAP